MALLYVRSIMRVMCVTLRDRVRSLSVYFDIIGQDNAVRTLTYLL